MASVEVFVKCNGKNCNKIIRRCLNEKYVRPSGTLKVSSYCRDCLKEAYRNKYRGRTSKEINQERKAQPVKIFSDEEKAQYAKERGLNYVRKS